MAEGFQGLRFFQLRVFGLPLLWLGALSLWGSGLNAQFCWGGGPKDYTFRATSEVKSRKSSTVRAVRVAKVQRTQVIMPTVDP